MCVYSLLSYYKFSKSLKEVKTFSSHQIENKKYQLKHNYLSFFLINYYVFALTVGKNTA